VLHRKLTTRVEDLQPGEWFKEKWSEWQTVLQTWHAKQTDWKEPAKRQAMKDELKNKLCQVGENGNIADIDIESHDFDVFAVDDIMDAGNAQPLFSEFAFEDWALLSLRFELHLLVHAFFKDVADPEREGIHVDHIPFYYNKYYRKAFNTSYYGVDSYEELIELIRDTVCFNPDNAVLESQLSDDLDNVDIFVKLTEENRRERQRCIDTGDETAILKFSKPAAPATFATAGAGAVGAPPPRPYMRGAQRPPLPARGYGGTGAQASKQWYNTPTPRPAYYGPANAGGYRPPLAGGRGYSMPQVYGQKRAYSYGKGYTR